MQAVELKIKNPHSSGANLIPVLLWLLLIILPALVGKFIFSAAIAMENQLEQSRLRQKFSIELQKYQNALEPRQWLRNRLFSASYDNFVFKMMAGTATDEDYRKNPFMASLGNFANSPDDEIANFSRHFFWPYRLQARFCISHGFRLSRLWLEDTRTLRTTAKLPGV